MTLADKVIYCVTACLSRQKLADYAKTAAYQEKLCSSLTEMAAILPAEGTVYSVY